MGGEGVKNIPNFLFYSGTKIIAQKEGFGVGSEWEGEGKATLAVKVHSIGCSSDLLLFL